MSYIRDLEGVPAGREIASRDPDQTLTGVVVGDPDTALSPLAQAAVKAGTSASTQRAYEHDWGRFTDWCDVNGRTPLPVSKQTLTEYVTYLCYVIVPGMGKKDWLARDGRRGLSPASVNRAVAAISNMHDEHGLDMPPRKDIQNVLKGYKEKLAKARDPRAKRRRAQAVTRTGLLALHESTDSERVVALRDRAMVLLGFVIRARISELVSVDIGDVVNTDRGLLVSVYRQKIREQSEKAIPRAYVPEMIDAILEWKTALAAIGRAEGPLFLRIHRGGKIGYAYGADDGRITADGARLVIKKAFRRAGVEGEFSGHSLCRGFATEARFAGHDKLTITRGGDWKDDSPAVDGYMEEADRWIYNALKGVGF